MTVSFVPSPNFEPAWDVAKLFPPQGQWSVEEYLALPTNHLVEWVEGRVEVLPMPTEAHQLLVQFLWSMLMNYASTTAGGLAMVAPMRLRVGDRFREPDVLYLGPNAQHHRGQQFWTAADLVMEVISPDDPDRDRIVKRREYAAGISEYWIVDPTDESVLVLTLAPKATEYPDPVVLHRGDEAVSQTVDGFKVDLNSLFDAAKV